VGLGEPIDYVGLSAHNFQFAYGDLNVRCENKATVMIDDARHVWTGQPIGAPVWKLVGQKVVAIRASLDNVLKFALSTGDEIEAWTEVGPYESVIVESKSHRILEMF
jgi:hypothetical protein